MATEQSKIYPNDPMRARVPEPQAANSEKQTGPVPHRSIAQAD